MVVHDVIFIANHVSVWVIIGEQDTVFYCVFSIGTSTDWNKKWNSTVNLNEAVLSIL